MTKKLFLVCSIIVSALFLAPSASFARDHASPVVLSADENDEKAKREAAKAEREAKLKEAEAKREAAKAEREAKLKEAEAKR